MKLRVFVIIFILKSISCTQKELNKTEFNPLSPYVKCSFLSWEFIECNEPIDHKGSVIPEHNNKYNNYNFVHKIIGNRTAKEELGHGCVKFGGVNYEDVEKTKVTCQVLEGIECSGDRNFLRDGVPCIKYTDHYFVTTLLYSILLGFLGLDRFCLGQTGTAVGKLLTLGSFLIQFQHKIIGFNQRIYCRWSWHLVDHRYCTINYK